MTERANELKALPLYANTLAEVNPTYARRAQLENLLRQSQYERFDSLCRYDRSAGSSVYQYLTLCCEVDELTAALRCLDAGRPGSRPAESLPRKAIYPPKSPKPTQIDREERLPCGTA